MNDNIQFLHALIRNPLKVGAVAPSSPALARQMMTGVHPDENNIVIELGVGTGAITKLIRSSLPNGKSYLGIELDGRLAASVRSRFPDLNIVCGSAADASQIYRDSGLGKVSYVLCGLPFVTLPEVVATDILLEVEKFMAEGCMFRTFQYAHGYYMPAAIRLRKFMRDRYGFSKRSRLVTRNVPPAYTLTWTTLSSRQTSKSKLT